MLEIRNLSAGYDRDLLILEDINLDVRDEQITAILGANGVGKSTLMKTVFGFLRPYSGGVDFMGRSLLGLPPHAMIGRGISYIPQRRSVFLDMSVVDNLRMGAWAFRKDRKKVDARLQEIFATFPFLETLQRRRAGHLSGGQQRMIEIGRALMMEPKLMLVDEPTAGLAKLVAAEIYEMLARLPMRGVSVLLVDQEIRQAMKIADYIYVFDLGRNRADGPPSAFEDLEATFWT